MKLNLFIDERETYVLICVNYINFYLKLIP